MRRQTDKTRPIFSGDPEDGPFVELSPRIGKDMANNDAMICEICSGQHVTKPAEHWCPECEEALCTECLTHHSISKYTRNHKVISVDYYKQLPPTICKITQHCDEHKKQFQLYCPCHESFCCVNCIITSHEECRGLMALDEFVKISKNSVSIWDIEDDVNNIRKNIQLVVEDRQRNLKDIQDEKQRFDEDVKSMRSKMNAHLNQIEESVNTRLEDSEKEIKSEIEKLLLTLSERLNGVKILEGYVLAIKNYATDIQTIIGIQTLKKEIKKQKEFIGSFAVDGSLQQTHLKYKTDYLIYSFLSSKTFGTVSVEKTSPRVIMRTKNQKQTDIMCSVQRQSKQINEITLHLLSKIDFEEMRDVKLFACTIAPNGNMIFANYLQKELIILNGNGKLVKIIDSNTNFLDVSCISNEFVAVTKYRTVEVINTENERVDKCYHTSSSPCGLIYFDTTLTWSVQGKGIQRADLENNEITTVVEHGGMPTYTYLTTDGKHIYHANNQNDTVTCYQLNGEISWEFKDESKIQRPSGITTDNDSNIYIASKRNNSIVVLSSDGKFDRKVLCFKDGIKQPIGISFDKKSSHLLVANEKNTAFLYNVS